MSLGSKISKKMMIISLIAVLFIPLIYSTLFSLSVWDPYGRVERLSVALVNEDKGAKQGDKEINIGNSLEKKLKESKSFNWEVVSKKEAEEGVKNEKYYMAMFIDKDFSESSIKLLDSNQKLNIKYLTNQSRDYVADLITSNGAKTIGTKLSNEITEKYISTITEKIVGFKDKLGDAVDGSNKLFNGSETMSEGLAKLTNGLTTLANGQTTMKGKVEFANSQYSQLTKGLGTINSKIDEFNEGQKKLNSGLKTVKDGTSTLSKKGTLISEGIGKLNNGLATVNSKLQDAVRNANNPENDKKLKSLQEGSTKVSSALKALSDGSLKLKNGIAQMNSGVPSAEELEKAKKSAQSQNLSFSNSEKLKLVREIKSDAKKLNSKYEEKLHRNPAFSKLTADEKKEILNTIYSVQDENLMTILGSAQKFIGDKIKEKSAGVKERVVKLIDGLLKIRNGLDNGLVEGTNRLSAGLSELNSKYQQLDSGVNKLIDTTKDSRTSIGKLAEGISQLKSGGEKLNSGYSQYYDGILKLDNGFNQITQGSDKLVDGGNLLKGGVEKASNGANKFQSEFFPKLLQGIDKLNDGSEKLVEGGEKLSDGNVKISDGLKKLNDGLANGKDQLEKSNLKTSASELLSNPIELVKETKKVENYGTSFIAYQAPLGIYLSAIALILVYPLTRNEEKISTAKLFLKKFRLLTLHAVVSAIITGVGLQAILKINLANPMMFYLLLILTALAYMLFISFCVLMFGNVGKFIVLLFFILQLSVAGGTFPVELSNSVYVFLNKLVPLTYVMKGLTYSIFGTTLNAHYTIAVIYTIFMFVTFSVLLYFAYVVTDKKRAETF